MIRTSRGSNGRGAGGASEPARGQGSGDGAATGSVQDDDVEAQARVVLDALRNVVRTLRLTAREAEGKVGLSAAQVFVLHKLADGRAASLGALAERTLTHQSSVSVVVSRLVARGLVARSSSRDDARRVELSITAAGRRVLARAPDVAQDTVIQAVRRLAVRDRESLARGLAALIREMGAVDEAPAMLFEDEPNTSRRAHSGRTSAAPAPRTRPKDRPR